MVELTLHGIQPRKATIVDVCHKFVYRFRDCLNQFQIRFPSASAIQMIHVGSGDEFDPTPLIKGIEDQSKRIKRIDDLYRSQSLTLHFYGTQTGRDEIAIWRRLAMMPTHGLRCATSSESDRMATIAEMRNCKTVVIGISALCTLSHLGLLKILAVADRTFVVALSTLEELQQLDEKDDAGPVVGGASAQTSRVKLLDRAHAIGELCTAIQEQCKVVPSLRTAEIDPQKRKLWIELAGRHNLDSLLLGAQADSILWSDDLVQDVIGQAEFRTRRIWTQAGMPRS